MANLTDGEIFAASLNVSNMTSLQTQDSASSQYFISLFLVYIPGFTLNIIAVILIIRDFKIVSIPTNAILFLLCLFDFLALLNPFLWHTLNIDYSNSLCALKVLVSGFFPLFTGYLSVLLSVDRAFAMWLPFTYKGRVTSQLWFICSLFLTAYVAAICSLPVLGTGSIFVYSFGRKACSGFPINVRGIQLIFPVLYAVNGYLVILTILICNIIVIRATLLLTKRTDIHPGGGCVCPANSYEILFARLVGFLTILYVLCWAPFYIEVLMKALGSDLGPWRGVVHSVAGLNYVIDPLVYVWIRKSIRVRLWETIKSSRCAQALSSRGRNA